MFSTVADAHPYCAVSLGRTGSGGVDVHAVVWGAVLLTLIAIMMVVEHLLWWIGLGMALSTYHAAAAAQGLHKCTPLQPYDPSFAGPQLKVLLTADPLNRVSFHRFGPLQSDARLKGTATPPLLLIMDFALNMYWWSVPATMALAQHREVIIFDNPGIGASSLTPTLEQLITISKLSDHVVDFARALNLQQQLKPDVLGISMGAMIALDIAARYGDAVRHVIPLGLMSGGPELPIAEQWGSPEQLADIGHNTTAVME